MSLFGIRKRIRENFSLKVYITFLAAIIFISILFNLLFLQWQIKNLKREIIEEGELLAQVLAHNAALGVFSEKEEQLRSPMEAVLQQQDVVSVSIYNHDGKLLARKHRPGSPPVLDQSPAGKSPADLAAAGSYHETSQGFVFQQQVRVSSYASEEDLYFSESPAVAEEVVGYVRVGMSKQRLRAGIRDLLLRSLGVGFLVLLVGALVTYFVVREVTKPLNRLIGEVEKQGVKVDSTDQLSILSGTYNELVAQLGKAFDTISGMKEDLEAKVHDRTRQLAIANEELSNRQAYLEETNRKLEETLRELKETQAQMVHSEKMVALGHLVAGVAHEINNTTNFITGALPPLGRSVDELKEILAVFEKIDRHGTKKAIVDQLKEAEDLKQELDYDRLLRNLDVLFANIKEGARRTTQIVNDLKNFARPGTAEWKSTDIHESIDSTLTLLYSEYKHQIEVVKDYDRELPLVPCSPSQLNQVFMNILLNAMQAIRGPGRIRIQTRKQGKDLHISIKDSGPGIPEAIRDRIFEPFFTTKPVGKGTGLGLSISYGIVKKHQGEIVVRSEPGKGTEFEIIMPLEGTGESYLAN
ncbi:MAG: ATP-binding protein [Desulfobacteraceae bacterium]|nr:ATP-binding protein [Desulfobacteraceae bacterium]